MIVMDENNGNIIGNNVEQQYSKDRQRSSSLTVKTNTTPADIVLTRSQSVSTKMATCWRNKQVSVEAIRSFEAKRKIECDTYHEKDRKYWQEFESVIYASKQESLRLEKFLTLKLQAVRMTEHSGQNPYSCFRMQRMPNPCYI